MDAAEKYDRLLFLAQLKRILMRDLNLRMWELDHCEFAIKMVEREIDPEPMFDPYKIGPNRTQMLFRIEMVVWPTSAPIPWNDGKKWDADGTAEEEHTELPSPRRQIEGR
jgi:hypothetical protein